MNDLQKTVLLKHGPDLVKDLIVTEALLGSMYHKKIFDQEMIDIIRVCQLPNDKVYKMLELIPKRGPEAFDSFIEILEEQYEWLAKLLKESLASENERISATQTSITTNEVSTPRISSSSIHLDSDIKTRASGFVQRQFGSIRKISMSDKKAIERWIGEWLQTERKRLTDAFDEAASNVFENPQIKGRLWVFYKHLCTRQKKPLKTRAVPSDEQANTNNTDAVAMDTEDFVDVLPQNMTFDFLEEEINELMDKMVSMEKQINRCYQYMGLPKNHQKEVSLAVHELYGEYRLKEREVAEEKRKMETMLVELYEYSTSTNRMQNIINNHEHTIRTLEEQLDQVIRENVTLAEEIKALERQNFIHLEKEKTLAELKQAKDGLQVMLNVVNKQNEELKKMVKDNNKVPVGRFYQPRRTSVPTNNNSNINNTKATSQSRTMPKRNPPKKKSNSFRS